VDGLLTASACAPALVEEIEKAGPFGSSNPEPVFVLPEHRILDVTPFGDDHLRIRVQSGDGARLELAAFRAAQGPLGAVLAKARGERAHIACSLSLDHWGGKAKVRARLVDLAICRAGASL
jgi:single-stranded-DNA-specific exonuclease